MGTDPTEVVTLRYSRLSVTGGERYGSSKEIYVAASTTSAQEQERRPMTTDDGFLDVPVSFSEGKMIGVRPGETVVHAAFDGVPTEKGLQVTVTADVDLDKIRVDPDLLP